MNTTPDVEPIHLAGFVAASRRAAECGLMRCSSGNMSFRVNDRLMLVTVSRSWMADLTEHDIAVCQIADGLPLNGKTPSVEIGFHAGILRARADVNVVLHFQTPCATTLACCQSQDTDYFVIPEIPYYIGPIGCVPYIMPGTPALAQAVTAAMQSHNLATMTNHGQVTVGATFNEAIQRAVFFELACEIILRGGSQTRPLSLQAATELRRA